MASRSSCPRPPLTAPNSRAADTENISPGITIAIAKEMRKLCQEPPEGIKVQLNEEEVTDIVADITGPGARRARVRLTRSRPAAQLS